MLRLTRGIRGGMPGLLRGSGQCTTHDGGEGDEEGAGRGRDTFCFAADELLGWRLVGNTRFCWFHFLHFKRAWFWILGEKREVHPCKEIKGAPPEQAYMSCICIFQALLG